VDPDIGIGAVLSIKFLKGKSTIAIAPCLGVTGLRPLRKLR
jgi:hypothetical protein